MPEVPARVVRTFMIEGQYGVALEYTEM